MLNKFVKGKEYRILDWKTISTMCDVVIEVGHDGEEYATVDDCIYYPTVIDQLEGKTFKADDELFYYIDDYCILPFICEEVDNNSLEFKMKELGFKLTGGESYDELMDLMIEYFKSGGKEPIQRKYDLHKNICDELNETYINKNHDYGDSFGETFEDLGIISAITRITDKLNRLKNLITSDKQLVKDESVDDTLKDMANYCIMTCIELELMRNK